MDNRLAAVVCAGVLLALPQTVLAGTQQFCAQWAYTFDDQGLGEDFLLHNAGQGSLGVTEALGAEAVISLDGVRIWDGHLDSGGCTASINAPTGSYTFWVTAASLVQGDVTFKVFPTDSEEPEWFSTTWEGLPEQNLIRKDTVTFGYGHPTASVAALAGLTLQRGNVGLPGGSYTLYAQQDCPGPNAFSGCFNGDSVYLGDDNLGNLEAFNKTVIAHELGHFSQNRLFGRLTNPYGYDGGPDFPLCSCAHVSSSNQEHCLQSIEHQSAAQVEGYAQFFAANLLNDGSQGDAQFAYYKEVNAFGQLTPPPVVFSALGSYQWLSNFCNVPQADNGDFLGTELDWMTFYYALHNTGGALAFSFDDIKSAYTTACQNQSCFGADLSYVELSGHVFSLFPADKANHWAEIAASRGVVP